MKESLSYKQIVFILAFLAGIFAIAIFIIMPTLKYVEQLILVALSC